MCVCGFPLCNEDSLKPPSQNGSRRIIYDLIYSNNHFIDRTERCMMGNFLFIAALCFCVCVSVTKLSLKLKCRFKLSIYEITLKFTASAAKPLEPIQGA